jgi:hypothetical protein
VLRKFSDGRERIECSSFSFYPILECLGTSSRFFKKDIKIENWNEDWSDKLRNDKQLDYDALFLLMQKCETDFSAQIKKQFKSPQFHEIVQFLSSQGAFQQKKKFLTVSGIYDPSKINPVCGCCTHECSLAVAVH